MAYDNTKVQAVLNQIHGLTSTGGTPVGGNTVPSILGMNFQSVSVGQKVVDRRVPQPGPHLQPPAPDRTRLRRPIGRPVRRRPRRSGADRLDADHHHGQARAVAEEPRPLPPDRREQRQVLWFPGHRLREPGRIRRRPRQPACRQRHRRRHRAVVVAGPGQRSRKRRGRPQGRPRHRQHPVDQARLLRQRDHLDVRHTVGRQRLHHPGNTRPGCRDPASTTA